MGCEIEADDVPLQEVVGAGVDTSRMNIERPVDTCDEVDQQQIRCSGGEQKRSCQ